MGKCGTPPAVPSGGTVMSVIPASGRPPSPGSSRYTASRCHRSGAGRDEKRVEAKLVWTVRIVRKLEARLGLETDFVTVKAGLAIKESIVVETAPAIGLEIEMQSAIEQAGVECHGRGAVGRGQSRQRDVKAQ